ncbi:nuclear transport factor 2 family protein [Arthrobacter sp. H20]|uniref:nuclear transport factor 2 family protein n=1 Tax=Arthrobacter sp. H20 TaxID=1267981 RepID=UPI00047AB1EC|nr:nuclear transport factor 2 family protein [Arthrobacter sp. H20]
MTEHPGLTHDDVAAAAARVVAAFSQTDTEAYFVSFSADATFVFHTEDRRLEQRSEYETLWQSWLADGWRVTECQSSNQSIQLLGDTAVFSHDVKTTINTGETTMERETIVFHRDDTGSLLAVHEHLSPLPDSLESR